MLGWINDAMEQLVIQHYGGMESWLIVKQAVAKQLEANSSRQADATIPEGGFYKMDYYTDQVTNLLAQETAKVAGLTLPELWQAFGKFFVHYTRGEGYDNFLACQGSTLKDWMSNINAIHQHLKSTLPSKMSVPQFWCEDSLAGDGSLVLHYHSPRGNYLAPMAQGVVQEIARDQFDLPIHMEQFRLQGQDGSRVTSWKITTKDAADMWKLSQKEKMSKREMASAPFKCAFTGMTARRPSGINLKKAAVRRNSWGDGEFDTPQRSAAAMRRTMSGANSLAIRRTLSGAGMAGMRAGLATSPSQARMNRTLSGTGLLSRGSQAGGGSSNAVWSATSGGDSKAGKNATWAPKAPADRPKPGPKPRQKKIDLGSSLTTMKTGRDKRSARRRSRATLDRISTQLMQQQQYEQDQEVAGAGGDQLNDSSNNNEIAGMNATNKQGDSSTLRPLPRVTRQSSDKSLDGEPIIPVNFRPRPQMVREGSGRRLLGAAGLQKQSSGRMLVKRTKSDSSDDGPARAVGGGVVLVGSLGGGRGGRGRGMGSHSGRGGRGMMQQPGRGAGRSSPGPGSSNETPSLSTTTNGDAQLTCSPPKQSEGRKLIEEKLRALGIKPKQPSGTSPGSTSNLQQQAKSGELGIRANLSNPTLQEKLNAFGIQSKNTSLNSLANPTPQQQEAANTTGGIEARLAALGIKQKLPGQPAPGDTSFAKGLAPSRASALLALKQNGLSNRNVEGTVQPGLSTTKLSPRKQISLSDESELDASTERALSRAAEHFGIGIAKPAPIATRTTSLESHASQAEVVAAFEAETAALVDDDVGLSGAVLKSLHPYHVMLDQDFNIIQVGNSLPGVIRRSEKDILGGHTSAVFEIVKPTDMTWSWKWLRLIEDQHFIVRPKERQVAELERTCFKTTAVHVSEFPPTVMLMMTPDADNLRQLRDMHLTLSDLPVHGAHRDAVFLREHLSTQMNNALKLEKLSRSLATEKDLLERLLPSHAAEALRNGIQLEPQMHQNVTLFFSDVVGFTTISKGLYPWQVIDMINRLYLVMDYLAMKFNLFKIEIIGDAYICCSGCPKPDKDHAKNIANFAIAVIHCCKHVLSPLDGKPLQLRIGLHTGPCASGIVGSSVPRFTVFGDTVNTCARHESSGVAMKVHVSQDTKKALEEHKGFLLTERGMIPMKGKGEMLTFFLEADECNELVNQAALAELDVEIEKLLKEAQFKQQETMDTLKTEAGDDMEIATALHGHARRSSSLVSLGGLSACSNRSQNSSKRSLSRSPVSKKKSHSSRRKEKNRRSVSPPPRRSASPSPRRRASPSPPPMKSRSPAHREISAGSNNSHRVKKKSALKNANEPPLARRSTNSLLSRKKRRSTNSINSLLSEEEDEEDSWPFSDDSLSSHILDGDDDDESSTNQDHSSNRDLSEHS